MKDYERTALLFERAILVAAGKFPVAHEENALVTGEALTGRPTPLASYRAEDIDVVLLHTRLADGDWRSDVIAVRSGDWINGGGGAGGPLVRRQDVIAGQPYSEGEGRYWLDNDLTLVTVDGVSADDAVRMVCGGEPVAEAAVSPHGHWVLAAVLPANAPLVTVESA